MMTLLLEKKSIDNKLGFLVGGHAEEHIVEVCFYGKTDFRIYLASIVICTGPENCLP